MRPRGVAQNSALALAGDLAAKAGLLAVTVVAARGLPTAAFAAFAAATALSGVLSAVLDAGSQLLLTRDGVAGPAELGGLLRALALARLPLLAAMLAVGAAIGVVEGHLTLALATVLLAAAGATQQTLTGGLRSAQDLRPEAIAKLATGVLSIAAAGLSVLLVPRPDTAVLALALATGIGLVPLLAPLRRVSGPAALVSPRSVLRRAAPLGVIALATLAYYRSGTIVLSIVSTPAQTARFATASTVAWGLLSVGNAVTTGLLPRLSATATRGERDALMWRAVRWLTGLALGLALGVAALAGPLLRLGFGARYGAAAPALTLLALATVLIAPAGVIGTALVAERRIRPVAVQVALSLVANLVVLAALAPSLGAVGAALATIACETLGLGLLLGAVRPRRAPVGIPRTFAAGAR